jgi:hypothetical protein
LEAERAAKYWLSPTACRGILNRAAKRGKELHGAAEGSPGVDRGPVAAEGGNRTSGPLDVAAALLAHGGGHGHGDFETETFVVSAQESQSGMREGGETFPTLDSNYGARRHNDVVTAPSVAETLRSHPRPGSNSLGGVVVDLTNGNLGGDGAGDAGTITTEQGHGNRGQFLVAPFDEVQITSRANRSRVEIGSPATTLNGSGRAGIVISDAGEDQPAAALRCEYGEQAFRGDGADNQIVGATEADVSQAVTANHGTSQNRRGTHVVEPEPGGWIVRRLMPVECERLQGWPDVVKTVTIHVWNKTHHGDRSQDSVSAGTPCTTAQSSALAAGDDGSRGSVNPVVAGRCLRHPSHERPVAVRVQIDLGRRVLELRSLSEQSSNADSAGANDWSARLELTEDFVPLAARISSILARTTQDGRAASLQYTTPSTLQLSGSRCVTVSGREIEEHADDVDTGSNRARGLLTSTTSEAGQSSQNFDSILKTFCCSVAHAIAGYIPERIRTTSSYDVELTISSGWTQFRANGSEIADGPRYRMVGNGVSATVAYWIARRMRAALEATS